MINRAKKEGRKIFQKSLDKTFLMPCKPKSLVHKSMTDTTNKYKEKYMEAHLDQTSKTKGKSRAGEIPQALKCLPCKHHT